jgi:type 1 fimbriae regulatory protein FimB
MIAGATTANVVGFPKRRERPRPRSKVSHFTGEQLKSFLMAAKACGKREYAMFLMAFSHGIRASEICNLRMNDLNLKQSTVRINRLKGSLESLQPFLFEKGTPLLNEEKAIREWLAVREADSDEFVFNSRKSDRLNRATVFRLFQGICKAAGIEDRTLWHPHVLKHTAGSLMAQKSGDAFAVKQHLGHRSFDSTLV